MPDPVNCSEITVVHTGMNSPCFGSGDGVVLEAGLEKQNRLLAQIVQKTRLFL